MDSPANPDLEKWSEITQLSESSMLPKLGFPYAFATEDGQSNENQKCIAGTKTQAGQKLAGILALLKSMDPDHTHDVSPQRRRQLVSLIALMGEQYLESNSPHSPDNKPWTSDANSKLVLDIILEMKRILNLSKNDPLLSQLFEVDFKTGINPTKTIFGQLLQSFRSKLVGQNEIWQHHPAAKSSFHWILLQIKYPYLSDFIPGSLQPALNFCDDFQVRNQMDSLDCFEHVIDNVNKAELCGSGPGSWCDVIYKSLIKMLDFAKDGQVILKLLPLILKTLKLLEKDLHAQSAQFSLYDDVLEKILHRIEFGSDDEYKMKTVWMQQLCSFLDIMGTGSLHWFARIIRILDENTTCNDPQRWIAILACVKICIVNSWMKPESESFAEIILKILYNITVFDIDCDAQIREEVVTRSLECLKLLSHSSDYESVQKQLREITLSSRNSTSPPSDRLQPKFAEVWNRISKDLNLLS